MNHPMLCAVQRNLAAITNRTWIMPPFHFTQPLPKKIFNKGTSDIVKGITGDVVDGETKLFQQAQHELKDAYQVLCFVLQDI